MSRFITAPNQAALPAPRNLPAGLATSSEPLSKNARKKIAREQRLREKKQRKKEERRTLKATERIRKRKEREEKLKHLSEEERQQILSERIQTMRAGRAEERERKAKLKKAFSDGTKYNVCIDLGWNDHMFDKERKSLARQLAYSYSALRKGVEDDLTPVKLSICGIDDVMKPVMTFAACGWEVWPFAMSQQSLLQMHSQCQVVYLTHDSENVLQSLDPDDVYVIGGIVDRNRLKNATMNKAKELGVRTARLNLDSHVSMEHGTPVLTVNHCLEILLYSANGMSWRDAYLKVLPPRKGIGAAEKEP